MITLKENNEIAKMIGDCRGIVYVDNQPTNIIINDDNDKKTVVNNRDIRAKSREILLKYLEKECQSKDYYKLKTWDELHAKIANYVENNPDKIHEALDESDSEIGGLINILGSKVCTIL